MSPDPQDDPRVDQLYVVTYLQTVLREASAARATQVGCAARALELARRVADYLARQEEPAVTTRIPRDEVFRARLRRARARGGETLRQVAVATGVSLKSIHDLESGRIKRPNFETVAKLALHYGLPLDEFAEALVPGWTGNRDRLLAACEEAADQLARARSILDEAGHQPPGGLCWAHETLQKAILESRRGHQA